MSAEHMVLLEESNYAFVTLFTLEMVLKQMGLGFREYFQSKANLFDSILVMLSFVEFALTY